MTYGGQIPYDQGIDSIMLRTERCIPTFTYQGNTLARQAPRSSGSGNFCAQAVMGSVSHLTICAMSDIVPEGLTEEGMRYEPL
jgi:hypothetical protein